MILQGCDSNSNSYKTSSDCRGLLNGVFEMVPGGDESKKIEIVREGAIQYEKMNNGNYTKLRINWIEDCVYETIVVESNIQLPESIRKERYDVPLVVKIVEVHESFYTFTAQRGNGHVMSDTLWIVGKGL
jgi:hypothetical protein